MSERDMLISMGFAAERVDWAIKVTGPDADLQARVDHILENESKPVPSISEPVPFPSPIRAVYAAPSHPPPGFIAPNIFQPQTPPAASPIQNLSRSMDQMNIRPLSHTMPSPHPNASTLEEEAVQRYRDFLQGIKANIYESQSNGSTAKTTYAAIMEFLTREGLKWREHLPLSIEDITTAPSTVDANIGDRALAVMPSPIVNQPDSGPGHEPRTQPTVAPVAKPSNASSDVYDPPLIYDPTRNFVPISPNLDHLWTTVVRKYYEDEPVEAIRRKIGEIRPRMTDKIANMRAQATLSLQDRRSQNEDQRLRQHASLMQELRVRQDWAGITRLEQEYKQQESRAKQEESARGHQEYCQTFLDPARDIIHAGFTELHPLYAELEGILNSDYPDLDVVRALTALEEVSDLMEQGMTDLEALQDDRRNRELESQRLHIIETAGPSNSWGDTSWLENQKKTADIEIKASRTAQKVDRRIAFYTLAQRKLEEAIAGVDHNRDALIAGIQEVLGRFRDVVPLEQEEAQAQAGNVGPSQLPLPSRLAYNQIKDVHAMLVDVDKMCNDMRQFLHNLKYKQVSENRLRDTAQLELSEHQQGRSDSWYFGAGEALRQQAARDDEAATKQFEQEKNERVAGMNGVNELVSAFTKQYIERERAVLHRLANGMTAQGPMDPATASAEGGPAKTAARTLNDIEEMRIVQQQAEILHGRMMVHQSAILGVMTAQAGYSIYNLV